MVVFVLML